MEEEPIKSHKDLEVHKEEIIHAVIRSPPPIPNKTRSTPDRSTGLALTGVRGRPIEVADCFFWGG